MSPITHLLLGWELASRAGLRERDRALVALASIAPDADGLGVVVDLMAPLLGAPTHLYASWHHALFHGLLGAALVALATARFAHQRAVTVALGIAVVHLHLLMDLLGSRGPGVQDLWPIRYLAPFSDALTLAWPGQWALDAWPNLLLSALLLALVGARSLREGVSPLSLASRRFDAVFVATLRRWCHSRQSA